VGGLLTPWWPPAVGETVPLPAVDSADGRGVALQRPRSRRALARRGSGEQVLHGRSRGVERPVRIAEGRGGHQDDVGLAFGHDRLGLGRLGDHPDEAGCDLRPAADRRGERDLAAEPRRDLRFAYGTWQPLEQWITSTPD
jgi:hypothetical protein